VIIGGKVEPSQVEEKGPGNCFFAEESGGVIDDGCEVLIRNPVIRAAAVLFLDIYP
jgi:hypothetical protein